MKKVKYAIIGFGGIAENRIAKEGFARDASRFKPLAAVQLVGATDIAPARRKAARALGLKWYAAADEILADPEIDAVYVATNNLNHAPLAKAAMRAGKHCLIEKPIATTVKDAKALSRLAARRGLSLTVDHMMTKNVYNIKARDLIAKKAVGKVNDICLHMEFLYGSTPDEAATWRCSNPDEVGGPVGDVASHCLYMAEFLLGSEIVSLACVYYPKTLKIKVEDGAYLKFTLRNGLTGSARVGFNEPRGGLAGTCANLGYEAYGAKGVIRTFSALGQLSGHADEPYPVRLEVDAGANTRDCRFKNVKNIYQAVILEHAQSILSGKPMDGSDAVHNLELVAAAHKSAQANGKIVRIRQT